METQEDRKIRLMQAVDLGKKAQSAFPYIQETLGQMFNDKVLEIINCDSQYLEAYREYLKVIQSLLIKCKQDISNGHEKEKLLIDLEGKQP